MQEVPQQEFAVEEARAREVVFFFVLVVWLLGCWVRVGSIVLGAGIDPLLFCGGLFWFVFCFGL
jgi:hypothetical protein